MQMIVGPALNVPRHHLLLLASVELNGTAYHRKPRRYRQGVFVVVEVEAFHNHPKFHFNRPVVQNWPRCLVIIAEDGLPHPSFVVLRFDIAINRCRNSCKWKDQHKFRVHFRAFNSLLQQM